MIRVSMGTPIVLLGLHGHTHSFIGMILSSNGSVVSSDLCLVLVQHRKTCPNMTEKLLAGTS